MKTEKSETSPQRAQPVLQERTKKRRRTQKPVSPQASATLPSTENPQTKPEEQPQEIERFHSAVGTEDEGLSPDLTPDTPAKEPTPLLEDSSSRQPSGTPPTGQSASFNEARGNEVRENDNDTTLVRVSKAVLRDLNANVPPTLTQKTISDPLPREVHIRMLEGVPSLSAGYGQEPDPIDWERFFINFEGAASRKDSLPKNRWIDVLRLHCDPSALDVLDTAMTELEADGLDITDFETLRDRMLFSREERYHPLTYLRQLLNLRQGKRSAADLGIFLRKLRTHYERATVRHTKFERWELPTIGVGLWGQCYLEALHPDISTALRAQCTMLDPTLPNYLHQLIRLATVVDKVPRTSDDKRASPPRPLSCPTIPDRSKGDMRSKDGPAGTPTRGTSRSTTRFTAPFPCCFCGQHGHRHQTCEKYQTFRNNRRWVRHACPKCLEKGHSLKDCKQQRGKYWAKSDAEWKALLEPRPPTPASPLTNPVSTVGISQDGEDHIIRLDSPPLVSPIIPTGSSEQRGSMDEIRTAGEVRRRRPGFTSEEEKLYDEMRQARRNTKCWDRTSEIQFRVLAEKRAMHRGEEMPTWTEDSSRVSDDILISRCASVSLHSRAGGNIFAEATVSGETVKALLDTGSARTLLDANTFTPERLPGFRSCTRSGRDALIDASGNRIPVIGVWEAWVSCAECAGCILVDVVKGLPAKAVLGLDSFRTLQLSVVYSGTTFELKAGGWKMRDLGFLRLSPARDRHAVIGGVSLRPSSYTHDHPDSERRRNLSVASHYAAHPRLYSVADDDDSMWELEAVNALNFGLGHDPDTFDYPNRHKRNRDFDSHLACTAFGISEQSGASQPGSTNLSNFPKTCEALLQMCDSTEAKLTQSQREQLKQLCFSYPEIWNAGDRPLATTNLTKFSVTLKDGVEPYCQPPRTEPPYKRERISLAVQKGLDAGIYEPSESPWGAPVVLVSRQGVDADDRLCADYRELNNRTVIPRYPLPRIQQALDALQGKAYFSLFDFPSAYYQVEVDEKSRPVLAFQTQDGHYQPTRMPFGAAGAPATQQRMVDNLLAGMKWSCALAYLDDVIVFSNTFEEHLQHLRKLFERAKKGSLHFKPQKCKLCHPETRYLGFLVSAEGVRPDPAKTAALENFPKPTNVRRLRSFLGLANHYRRFIKDYARIAKPLVELTHANEKFEWTDSKQEAFNKIKRAIVEVAKLAHPQPGKPFIIDCDACKDGLGAVLAQADAQGREHPIAFASRLLRPNESRWSTTELEAYAVVWALDTFRAYVEGSPTLVRTDHSPLPWIRNNVGKSAKIARWVLALQDFSFDLKHRAGKCHNVPDALSRNATGEPGDDEDLMCYARVSARCGVCATATPTTPHEDMSREQHVSRAGGGTQAIEAQHRDADVSEDQYRQSPTIISMHDIRTAQATCPETILLRQVLDCTPGANLPHWAEKEGLVPVLRNGVLCLEKEDGSQRRVHIPIVLRTAVIQRVHCGPYTGHHGRHKTIRGLRARFIWGTLSRDVKKVLKTCVQCWRHSRGHLKSQIPQAKLPIGWPGDIVALDIFGPLPTARSGARYVLVGIDHFSRWVELAALQHVRELEVVAFLRDVWIPHHGVPRVVLSDNGPQFIAEVVKKLCHLIGADKIYSSPYHPQGNAICESFMRTLKRALASSITEDGRDWDAYLQAVAFAHNTTPHTSTDHSPYFLLHGREAVLPIQRYLDTPPLDPPSKRWLARLWAARVQVYQEHMKAANERKRLLSEPGAILPRGTVVAIKLTPAELLGVSRKLAPRYSGPWTISRVLGNGTTYCVHDPVTREEKQVPRDKIKVLELEGSTITPAEGILPRWLAPGEYRPNAPYVNRAEDWLQSYGPEENLPESEPIQHESPCRETPPLSGEVNEPALGAEPLRDGLRWTLSRRARAAPGGVFVRARRGRRARAGGG